MPSELEREIERFPKVTMETRYGEASKYRDDMENNWRVVLHFDGRELTTDYYGGSAVTEITAADVLNSLMTDAEAGNQSFENFCSDFGYDEDSRQAYATWKACKAIGPKVRRLLGTSYGRFYGREH